MSRSGTVDSCYPYSALLEEASRVLPLTGEKWAVGMASTGTTQEEQEKGYQLPHGAGWEAHSWQFGNPNYLLSAKAFGLSSPQESLFFPL